MHNNVVEEQLPPIQTTVCGEPLASSSMVLYALIDAGTMSQCSVRRASDRPMEYVPSNLPRCSISLITGSELTETVDNAVHPGKPVQVYVIDHDAKARQFTQAEPK